MKIRTMTAWRSLPRSRRWALSSASLWDIPPYAPDILHRYGGLRARPVVRRAVAAGVCGAGPWSAWPIFTQGGGIGYLMQPTCGFLIGLIPAAWVIGRIAGRKPEPKQIVPACLLGYGVLYAIGVPYMALILNTFLGKGMGFSAIMWAGMIPFLPGDMIKILCITLLMPPILRQLDKLDK